jgi:hypothetical protein
MTVWFCIPSARPAGGTARAWKDAGYKVALCRDQEDECRELFADGIVLVRPYTGYASSVDDLIKAVLASDPECSWAVSGGDDTLPDPTHAPDQIAKELTAHFGGTFGVCQPTGDRWAGGSIDRICGSPWMGREFCERAYGGNGPMWAGWHHMYTDCELQAVAIKLRCFLQRPDLVHRHEHFCRSGEAVDWGNPIPEFLQLANSPEYWHKYGHIYQVREAAGFPGHEPI